MKSERAQEIAEMLPHLVYTGNGYFADRRTTKEYRGKVVHSPELLEALQFIQQDARDSALREAAEVKVSFPSYVESPHEAELFEAGRQAFENEVRALIPNPKP
jgi:hypothetical protein